MPLSLNNSFLDNPTFRGMRYHLMQSFDTLYILDLHGNTRKKELSPDGSKDENVFDIMQGVSINIFMKNRNSPLGNHTESKEPSCQIYHYDLYGKRKDKYNFLYENSLDSIPWNRLNPKPPFFLFIPQNENLREEYDKGISVKDMFRISSVGVVGGRDKFVMSESDSQKSLQDFKNRIKRFLELDIESARKEFYLGQDSRDWKVEYAQKELKNTGNNPNNYVKIHYRPFDYRWTYYTGKSKGFHCMPRGEVMEHFLQDSMSLRGEAKESGNMGLSIARQLKDTKIEWNHCMMTQHITDQALTTGGNGPNTIFPLHISNTKSAQKNPKKNAKNTQENGLFSDEDLANDIFKGKERIENFTPEFRAFVDSKYTWDSKDIKANPHLFLDSHTLTPEAILGYLYAVLFHKGYREKYLDFLKIDFPKIPFVESKEKFIALSKLGLELMSVHLMADNERERERERTEINENESQYWTKYRQTIQTSRKLAVCDSNKYDSGFMSYGWRQHGSGADIPSLSLQHRARKEDSMQNIGLVCDRGCKLNKIDNIFITQNIIDLHLVGSGSYVFPLYLYDKEAQ